MAKIMDNDSLLHDDEPTAELPVLADVDPDGATGSIVELDESNRVNPKRAKGGKQSAANSGEDHDSLSSRLKKAVQEYVEQGEALRAVAKELAIQSTELEQSQTELARAEAQIENRDQQIEAAKQEMIAGLLTQARIDIANQRYFGPDSNNAVYQYKKILELKNDHPAAINGLNELADQFVEKIESNIANENWKQAQQDLDTLRTLPVKIDVVKDAVNLVW